MKALFGFILVAALVVAASSCKKRDADPEGCNINSSRIARLGFLSQGTDTGWKTYSYNAGNQLTSFGISSPTYVVYPDEKTVIYQDNSTHYTFEFNELGQISRHLILIGADTNTLNEWTLSYNDYGQLVKWVLRAASKAPQFPITAIDSATFTWRHGNVVCQVERRNNSVDSTVYDYERAVSGQQFYANPPGLLGEFAAFINRPGAHIVLPVSAVSKATHYSNGQLNYYETFAYTLDGNDRIVQTTITPKYILNPPPIDIEPHYRFYQYECF